MKTTAISRRSFLEGSALVLSGAAAASGALAQQAAAGGELTGLTLAQASRLMRSGQASPVDLVQACLARIDRLNPLLNAFITVAPEQALARARELEAEMQKGDLRGPLHGVPIALKDNIDTATLRTTGASELFENRMPEEDAEVTRRLLEAGAIVLGKLNLNEFAYGGSSTVTHYGTMHNPWDLDRATGGSSGGSGAAVAADLCYAALGTDTAGSVRIPAAHCGLVGIKPTQGRVSTRGVLMLSWTLDQVGPLCKSVEDAALMLGCIAGYDPREPVALDRPVPDYTRVLGADVSQFRLGIARSPYFDNLDAEVERLVSDAIDLLRSIAAGTREVRLPSAPSGASIWGPEAYAYHKPWITTSPELYQPSTRAALERYANADAAEYAQARRDVELARRAVLDVFNEVDVLLTPVMREPAPLLSDGGGSGASAGTADFNVFGLPAISVPCGFTAAGLPVGLQIAAAPFMEERLLALASHYERLTQWHLRKPPL